jgi:hypothetical protein
MYFFVHILIELKNFKDFFLAYENYEQNYYYYY